MAQLQSSGATAAQLASICTSPDTSCVSGGATSSPSSTSQCTTPKGVALTCTSAEAEIGEAARGGATFEQITGAMTKGQIGYVCTQCMAQLQSSGATAAQLASICTSPDTSCVSGGATSPTSSVAAPP